MEVDSESIFVRDGHVWTSAGVIAGVGAVFVTGWLWLDAAIALAVAANIIRTGTGLVSRPVRRRRPGL